MRLIQNITLGSVMGLGTLGITNDALAQEPVSRPHSSTLKISQADKALSNKIASNIVHARGILEKMKQDGFTDKDIEKKGLELASEATQKFMTTNEARLKKLAKEVAKDATWDTIKDIAGKALFIVFLSALTGGMIVGATEVWGKSK